MFDIPVIIASAIVDVGVGSYFIHRGGNQTQMITAIKKRNNEKFDELFKKYSVNIPSSKDRYYQSYPLYMAIYYGNKYAFDKIIEEHEDFSMKDKDNHGWIVYVNTIFEKADTLVKKQIVIDDYLIPLIAHGADIEVVNDKIGCIDVKLAANDRSYKDYAIGNWILRAGTTLFGAACFAKNKRLVEQLLQAGANTLNLCQRGENALHHACYFKDGVITKQGIELITLLRNDYANNKAKYGNNDPMLAYNKSNKTPLHYFIANEFPEDENIRNQYDEIINAYNNVQSVPNSFIVSICENNLYTAQILRDRNRSILTTTLGTSINTGEWFIRDNSNALLLATYFGTLEMMRWLLDQHITVDGVERDVFNVDDNIPAGAIHHAAYRLNKEKLQYLLEEKNNNINLTNRVGHTALMMACHGINNENAAKVLEIVQYLLQRGADPSIAGHDGKVPFDNLMYQKTDMPGIWYIHFVVAKTLVRNNHMAISKSILEKLHDPFDPEATFIQEIIQECANGIVDIAFVSRVCAVQYPKFGEYVRRSQDNIIGKLLLLAIQKNNKEVVEILYDINPNIINNTLESTTSTEKSSDNIGWQINAGTNILQLVVYYADINMLEWVWSRKQWNINSLEGGDTALHHAARRLNISKIRWLLSRGAQMNVLNTDNNTVWQVLINAIKYCNPTIDSLFNIVATCKNVDRFSVHYNYQIDQLKWIIRNLVDDNGRYQFELGKEILEQHGRINDIPMLFSCLLQNHPNYLVMHMQVMLPKHPEFYTLKYQGKKKERHIVKKFAKLQMNVEEYDQLVSLVKGKNLLNKYIIEQDDELFETLIQTGLYDEDELKTTIYKLLELIKVTGHNLNSDRLYAMFGIAMFRYRIDKTQKQEVDEFNKFYNQVTIHHRNNLQKHIFLACHKLGYVVKFDKIIKFCNVSVIERLLFLTTITNIERRDRIVVYKLLEQQYKDLYSIPQVQKLMDAVSRVNAYYHSRNNNLQDMRKDTLQIVFVKDTLIDSAMLSYMTSQKGEAVGVNTVDHKINIASTAMIRNKQELDRKNSVVQLLQNENNIKQVRGTLIHELCHYIARRCINSDWATPYDPKNIQDMRAFQKAKYEIIQHYYVLQNDVNIEKDIENTFNIIIFPLRNDFLNHTASSRYGMNMGKLQQIADFLNNIRTNDIERKKINTVDKLKQLVLSISFLNDEEKERLQYFIIDNYHEIFMKRLKKEEINLDNIGFNCTVYNAFFYDFNNQDVELIVRCVQMYTQQDLEGFSFFEKNASELINYYNNIFLQRVEEELTKPQNLAITQNEAVSNITDNFLDVLEIKMYQKPIIDVLIQPLNDVAINIITQTMKQATTMSQTENLFMNKISSIALNQQRQVK